MDLRWSILKNVPKLIFPQLLPLNFKLGEIGLVLKECDIHGIVHLPSEGGITLISFLVG